MIIATHNPLMIGSLHRNQVRILAHEDSRIVSSEPEYDPIGIGVEGLLKSDLYGLRSMLAPEVLKNIDTQNRLLTLPQRRAVQEKDPREASERLEP